MNNKILIFIFILIILIVFGFVLFFIKAASPKKAGEPRAVTGRVCFKEHCFSVKLAQNSAERAKGLMFQKSMDQNSGMLFLFDKEAIYSFWMKNTFIPLDIIWINENNKVVFISDNNQPCESYICHSIVPTAKAKYVLELNAGVVEKIGLKLEDELNLAY